MLILKMLLFAANAQRFSPRHTSTQLELRLQHYASTHGSTQKELMQNRTEPTHRAEREGLCRKCNLFQFLLSPCIVENSNKINFRV